MECNVKSKISEMKIFEIRVTQNLSGYYEGVIKVEASNKKGALKKIRSMLKEEIDDAASWTHGDEYDGDIDSIEIDEGSINEI
jgi:hypothetical protein